MPVPAREPVSEDGVALLAKVSVPLAVPVACGLKVTVKFALWPEGMVTGKVIPLNANRELLLLAEVTVTSAPVAVRLPVAVPLAPTATLPTFKVAGVTANCADCSVVEVFVTGMLATPEEPQPSMADRLAVTARHAKMATCRVRVAFMRNWFFILETRTNVDSDRVNLVPVDTTVCL